ncbi:uncharacterized protein LOC142597946 [Dermatophagoides farinae]|uniref:uncharacterized protein LOC142597946 n=1 Tax=Dermatophagoides farinae TaxID=6954 RepID=UPI003F5DED24
MADKLHKGKLENLPKEEVKNFTSNDPDIKLPIVAYRRYLDEVFILIHISEKDSNEIVCQYVQEKSDVFSDNKLLFDDSCQLIWPESYRMRFVAEDFRLANVVYTFISARIPKYVAEICASDSFVSIYSAENPNLLLKMCNFDLRFLPRCRESDILKLSSDIDVDPTSIISTSSAFWPLHSIDNEVIATLYLTISKEGIHEFENRIRNILQCTTNATFTKVAAKWNTTLLSMLAYYREAAVTSERMLDLIVKSENKIQVRIKSGLNSKMPSRFPPVVFYAPKELGGLGMLSMGHVLIPSADLKYSKQVESVITHFRAGLGDIETNSVIPNLYRYINSWETEFNDSVIVWNEYLLKRKLCTIENRKLSLEDVNDIWDRGLPRINVLFQKNRFLLYYNRGWRARAEFVKYQTCKWVLFYWTSQYFDGRLWNLNNYRTDIIQALGGIECILEHSLFKATFFSSWEGLFWQRNQGLEVVLKCKKLTNAQRSGLNQIPNRRFALWWSPTINRANVYIGFQVQLDLTGIFMHGKIPILKICLVQIFRAHLWQKIHESLVMDLCQLLDLETLNLKLSSVKKMSIHPRKSYKMNFSAADILLETINPVLLSEPSLLSKEDAYASNPDDARNLFIDIQLCWGNYDTHNIEKHSKIKYLDYTTDAVTLYPCKNGIVIGFDLAYNIYSAYGRYFHRFKPFLRDALEKMNRNNPALYILRERIKKSLQLHSNMPDQMKFTTINLSAMLNNQSAWFIDDKNVYRVSIHRTFEGNLATKPVNGAIFIVNAATGELFLKIVHSSVWAGQKRLSQLSKWKAAEEISLLIRSMPVEAHPSELILIRKSTMDPIEVNLLDYPDIQIKHSELDLPFAALIKVPKLRALIDAAEKSELHIYNIYDDWLNEISAYTAFTRLLIILRAALVNTEETIKLLNENMNPNSPHIWPTLSLDLWEKLESELTDIVLNNYAIRNNISIQGTIINITNISNPTVISVPV